MNAAKLEPPPEPRIARASLAPGELTPNPRNARRHSKAQLERLTASLRKFGQTKPVLARAENRMLVAGEGIWRAAKRAGLAQLDVLLWAVDQATADAYMLADNRLGDLSSDDLDRVAELLRGIDALDLDAIGYGLEDATRLIEALAPAAAKAFELDAAPEAARFLITVRGPLAQQALVLERLKEIAAEVPGLEIELGTPDKP